MIRLLKWLTIIGGLIGVVLVVLAILGVQGAQQEDTWYTEAVTIDAGDELELIEAGEAFEKQATDLRNEVEDPGFWQATFTDRQINGWLASGAKNGQRVPKSLPKSVKDPRVKFEPNLARIACRVKTSKLNSALFIGVDIQLTDNPNELAVHLHECRAGWWPIPVEQIKKVVDKTAAKANLPLRWVEVDGEEIALIQVPERNDEIEGRLVLETVEIREGEVHLSGTTILDDGTGGGSDVQRVIVSQLFNKDINQR